MFCHFRTYQDVPIATSRHEYGGRGEALGLQFLAFSSWWRRYPKRGRVRLMLVYLLGWDRRCPSFPLRHRFTLTYQREERTWDSAICSALPWNGALLVSFATTIATAYSATEEQIEDVSKVCVHQRYLRCVNGFLAVRIQNVFKWNSS